LEKIDAFMNVGFAMRSSEGKHEHIQVLVADSNQTQSQLLTSALRRQPWMTVRSCGSKLPHCLEGLRSDPVDVLVLSYDPSDPNHQIETLRALHSTYPSLCLILSLDKFDQNLVVEALRAGAQGLFCRADQPFRALCRCIAAVNHGEFWVSSEQLGYVIDALRMGVHRRVVNAKNGALLSRREEQVVTLVADGIGNREVAQRLGVKENTIKKSLLRIYNKLGVSSRVELVLYVLAHQGTSGSAKYSAEVLRKGPMSAAGGSHALKGDWPVNSQ
jgi:two-component system nitrate/nitrite response regulator NarL